MVIQVKEFRPSIIKEITETANKFLKKKKIKKSQLIEIKYINSVAGPSLLIIYEDNKN